MRISDINTLPSEEVKAQMELASQTKKTHFLFQHRLANREVRDVEVFSAPFNINGRRLLYSIVQDITERKKIEEELQTTKGRLEAIFNQMPVGITVIEAPKGKIILQNKEVERQFRYELFPTEGIKEYEKWPVFNLDGTPVKTGGHVIGRSLMEGVTFRDRVEKILRGDGTFGYLSTTSAPIYDKEGIMVAAIAMNIDVTDQVKEREALDESEARLRTYMDNAPEGIFITDEMGNYVYVNRKASEMLIYTREELLKLNFVDLISGMLQDLQRRFEELKQKGAITWETTLKRKNGTEVPIFLNAVSLPNQRYMAFCTEITERKRAEEALKHANAKLGIMNDVTRHDMLNQIALLRGFLELSRIHGKDPVLVNYFETMSRATDNLQKQIAFTKDYQDMGVKAPTWVSVGRQTADAFDLLHPPGVTMEDATGGVELLADQLAEKVPYNLIDNSIRHGEHVTHIKVSSEQRGDAMLIVYQDDGRGVSDKDRKHLFEKGFGINTGLGLFLVREILAITGITIEENGLAGHGVRFEMLVPAGAWRLSQN
jgi:PAS domain S-box-containing protein